MPDFSKRSSEEEIMDDLNCSGQDLNQALKELDTINYLLGGNYVTLKGIDRLVQLTQTSKRFKIVDLGCGSGDILRRIRKFLDTKNIKATLTGIDANKNVIRYARANTSASLDIQWETINIFSDEFKLRKFDIVTGTLFFHHFSSEQLIGFFEQLKKQTSVGIVINDIHRHWFSFYSIKWLTQFFSRSQMVKHDAPQSVLRAFTKNELMEILRKAGCQDFHIQWQWAFRWLVIVRF